MIMTLAEIVDDYRKYRHTYHPIVLVTGCFDILHRGHIDLLSEAGMFGMVAVGINSDNAVRVLKGKGRPINKEQDRAYVLNHLQMVDRVFIIDDIRVDKAIRSVAPNIWMKGGDYTLESLDKDEVAAARAVRAEILIFKRVGNYSSTQTIEALNAS